MLLLEKLRFYASKAIVALSFRQLFKRRIPYLSSARSILAKSYDSIWYYALRLVFRRICETNISLTLSWVPLCHDAVEANFAEGALFDI
jgi:hypothetical protein